MTSVGGARAKNTIMMRAKNIPIIINDLVTSPISYMGMSRMTQKAMPAKRQQLIAVCRWHNQAVYPHELLKLFRWSQAVRKTLRKC
jgi:hypothetical protein